MVDKKDQEPNRLQEKDKQKKPTKEGGGGGWAEGTRGGMLTLCLEGTKGSYRNKRSKKMRRQLPQVGRVSQPQPLWWNRNQKKFSRALCQKNDAKKMSNQTAVGPCLRVSKKKRVQGDKIGTGGFLTGWKLNKRLFE